MSWTEMAAMLGGGDLAKGGANVKEGISRGDVELKQDGFYYFKRVLATDTLLRQWGQHVEQLKNLENGAEVAGMLETQEWSKYAFSSTSTASSPTSSGASPAAMDHLQSAYDAIHKSIQSVRKTGMAIRKIGNATKSTMTLIDNALQTASALESGSVAKMVKMLVTPTTELNDPTIKTLLKSSTHEFSSLMSSELELAALHKGLAKSAKES